MLLENGTYRAVVKDISVYLRGENERLTAAFRLECEGKELVHREWLELNDGTISDKTIRRLRECFPKWDGSIETLEQGFCVHGVEVEVTVENEQDKQDPEKWWTRVRFMNAPGGVSGSAALPEKVNRATLVSKYGARFRALGLSPATRYGARSVGRPASSASRTTPGQGSQEEGGGQTGGKPLAEAQGAQRNGKKAGPPEGRSGQDARAPGVTPSTLEECWEALCKKHPDEMREQVGERWFGILERVAPGKDQTELGPEDWGAVMAAIAVPA